MGRLIIIVTLTSILLACSNVKPGEEKATILAHDISRTSCGGSWIIQGQENQFRTIDLPQAYQKANLAVWIKYESDVVHSAGCNFINLVSIRER